MPDPAYILYLVRQYWPFAAYAAVVLWLLYCIYQVGV